MYRNRKVGCAKETAISRIGLEWNNGRSGRKERGRELDML